MSGLDFVVHRVLYGYGLRFDYDWAVFYWNVYASVFFVFGGSVGFVYWLGSDRSFSDIKVGLGLFLTVCLLFFGGLSDVLWFALWSGVCQAMMLFGGGRLGIEFLVFGTFFAQLFLLFGVFVVLVLFWFYVLR